MKRSSLTIISCILVIILLFSSCTESTTKGFNGLEKYQDSIFGYFDTVTRLVGYAKNEQDFNDIKLRVEQKLRRYHELYDIYNDYKGVNNLKTINDNAGIAPVVVEAEIIELLELGKEIHSETNGLTNIAMGSVLKIWHEFRGQGESNPANAKLPPRDILEEAAKHIDIDKVVIDKQAKTVFLSDPQMSLDVGSLGKGFAVEQICESLAEEGVDNLLVNVGGNVRAIGKKPDGSFWEIGIENPYGGEEFQGILLLDNKAFVTSGNYQRYYMVDGVKYHHIINPRTLMPENNMASVAILCDDSGLADGYTTALYNMTPEEGKKWIEQKEGVEAIWMLNNQSKSYTDGFGENLGSIR